MKEQIEALQTRNRTLHREKYDLEKACRTTIWQDCLQLEKQLEMEEEKVKKEDRTLVQENVTDDEIAKIVSRWTGIPVTKAE